MLTQTFLWLLIVAQMSGDGKFWRLSKISAQFIKITLNIAQNPRAILPKPSEGFLKL